MSRPTRCASTLSSLPSGAGICHPWQPRPGVRRHYFVARWGPSRSWDSWATAAMSTNQFGFDASGFRRYFLLPIAPGAILRACSYTALFVEARWWPSRWCCGWSFRAGPIRLRAWRPCCWPAGWRTVCSMPCRSGLRCSRRGPRAFETTFGNQLLWPPTCCLSAACWAVLFGADCHGQWPAPVC